MAEYEGLFESAWQKLNRGWEHASESRRLVDEYAATGPCKILADGRCEPIPIFMVLDDPVPSGPMIAAGDAVHNFRAALDHCIWSLAVNKDMYHGSPEDMRKVSLPVGRKDKANFEAIVKKCAFLRPDAKSFISSLEIYPGGRSDWVLRICDLDNMDKHMVIIPAYVSLTLLGMSSESTDFEGNTTVVHLGDKEFGIGYNSNRIYQTIHGSHFGLRKIGHSSHGPLGPRMNLTGISKITLLFSGIDNYGSDHIGTSLDVMGSKVEAMIREFEAFALSRK